jgi:hypothetical protein
MAITWADVEDLAPALSAVGADSQTAILAIVAVRVVASRWGANYTEAASYLAAHIGTLTLRAATAAGTGSGPITSETVGPISRSYAAPTSAMASDSSLHLTPWGLAYREACRMRGKLAVVA